MGALKETAATLRFFGDDLDPADITAALGSQPSVAARKGEIWRTPAGTEKVARRGFWRLETERCSPGALDGQIDELLSAVTDDLAVWALLTSNYEADIFCGLFLGEENEGFSLSPKTSNAAGVRGLELNFDLYSSDRAE